MSTAPLSFIRFLSFIVMLCLFSTTAQAQEKLLILGDSISTAYGMAPEKGWVQLMKKKISTAQLPVEIINASIAGATTNSQLTALEKLLETHHPNKLLIELGGNDGLQGKPIEQIKNNLNKIIKQAQQVDATVYLMQMDLPTNFGTRYRKLFRNLYVEVASAHSVLLIPSLFTQVGLAKDKMQADGIHPNEQAQPIIANHVFQFVVQSKK